jgi:CBS domain-containing protein
VAKVKRFESGVVKEPITIPPSMSVRQVLALTQQYRISGLPVVEGRTSSASSPTATCGSRRISTSRWPTS